MSTVSSPTSTCSMTASSRTDHPASRDLASASPRQATRARTPGAAPVRLLPLPQSEGAAGRREPAANTSASSRCRHVSSETTAAEVSSIRSSRSASGWSSTTTRAGSPAATSMDVTVKPARSTNAPAVQVTRPLRSGRGSDGSGPGPRRPARGWLEWIVTRPPRRASGHRETPRRARPRRRRPPLLGLSGDRVHSPRRPRSPRERRARPGGVEDDVGLGMGLDVLLRRDDVDRVLLPPVPSGPVGVISTASSSWAGESESG